VPPARRSQFLAPLAARLGAIVKGGTHQETLGRLDTVVLDKTGTLTFGRPEVQRIAPVAGVRDTELLDAAATNELHSPLGERSLPMHTVWVARSQSSRSLRPRAPGAAR